MSLETIIEPIEETVEATIAITSRMHDTGAQTLETMAQDILADKGLISALLTGPRNRQPDSVTQVQVKPVLLRGEHKYQFTYFKNRKVLHRNLSPEETQAELVSLLPVGP